MKFSEIAAQVEGEVNQLKDKLKGIVDQAAKKNSGYNNLSRELGMSVSYIGNLVKQDQGIAALLKGIRIIDKAYKDGKL